MNTCTPASPSQDRIDPSGQGQDRASGCEGVAVSEAAALDACHGGRGPGAFGTRLKAKHDARHLGVVGHDHQHMRAQSHLGFRKVGEPLDRIVNLYPGRHEVSRRNLVAWVVAYKPVKHPLRLRRHLHQSQRHGAGGEGWMESLVKPE